jgi:hypothetical protein
MTVLMSSKAEKGFETFELYISKEFIYAQEERKGTYFDHSRHFENLEARKHT